MIDGIIFIGIVVIIVVYDHVNELRYRSLLALLKSIADKLDTE